MNPSDSETPLSFPEKLRQKVRRNASGDLGTGPIGAPPALHLQLFSGLRRMYPLLQRALLQLFKRKNQLLIQCHAMC